MAKYLARSASDKTDDWPFWFVADQERGGINVTLQLVREHICPSAHGLPFLSRANAEALVKKMEGSHL